MKITRKIVLAGLLACSVSTALAQTDVRGAKDPEVLERYAGSWIVRFKEQPRERYTLALGGIETVNGIERPERSETLTGELVRLTYEMPQGTRTRDVYRAFKDQLSSRDATVRFECNGRSCGSSSVWANEIYNESKLYGLVDSQYVVNAQLPGQTLSLYIVERGNRRVYAHLDVVETDPAARLTAEALTEGYAVIAVDELPGPSVLSSVIEQLSAKGLSPTLVVHHQGVSFDDAANQASAMANQLKESLSALPSVQVQSLGAYAPSVLKDHASVIVMVVQRP